MLSLCGILAGSAMAQQDAPQLMGTAGPEPVMVQDQIAKPAAAPLSKMHGVKLGDQVATVALPAAPVAQWQNEDAQPGASIPRRVGVGRPVIIGLNQGQWVNTPDGGMLWVVEILSPQAQGLRLHFTRFSLPEGAELRVYDPLDSAGVSPVYRDRGDDGSGSFYAWSTFGQSVRVELLIPAGMPLPADPFLIDEVQHFYRDIAQAPGDVNPAEGNCHNDVTCFSAWNNVKQSTAQLVFTKSGGTFICTGEMMNNVTSDLHPYFMTANHCFSTNASANSLECYWFFQTSTCNGTPPSKSSVPRSTYATLLSTGAPSDYTFCRIDGTVPRNLWWNGWSAGYPAGGTSLTGIHHPSGAYKRISFGSKINTTCGGDNSNHFGVSWSSGVTEGGSSGSGVYLSNGQFVGQLHCGASVCGGSNQTDSYGAFSVTYPNISSFLQNQGFDDSTSSDTCAAAINLGGVGANNWGTHYLRINHDDHYKVTVPAFGTLYTSIGFTHNYGDIDLYVLDGCGSVVASSTGTTNSEVISLTNTTASAKVYTIRATLFNDTYNFYSLYTSVQNPAPPASDACGSAQALTLGQTVSGTTVGSTNDGQACTGTNDVWFRFTAPCTGTVVLDTLGSAFDTVLSVHSGCPGTTNNMLACNDDAAPPQRWSRVSLPVTRNTNYLIRIAGFSGAVGNYTLNSTLVAPANNACSTPDQMNEGALAFDTCGATTDGPAEPNNAPYGYSQIDNDVWIYYFPTANGTATFDTCTSLSFDTKIAVYDYTNNGCPSAENTALAVSDDNVCGLGSSITLPVNTQTAYLVRIGGYLGARGSGVLTISNIADPSCPADFNGDTVVDFFDYLDFVAAFSSNDPAADFNADSVIDFFDYLDFVAAFSSGC
jgi:hypothetical protein